MGYLTFPEVSNSVLYVLFQQFHIQFPPVLPHVFLKVPVYFYECNILLYLSGSLIRKVVVFTFLLFFRSLAFSSISGRVFSIIPSTWDCLGIYGHLSVLFCSSPGLGFTLRPWFFQEDHSVPMQRVLYLGCGQYHGHHLAEAVSTDNSVSYGKALSPPLSS